MTPSDKATADTIGPSGKKIEVLNCWEGEIYVSGGHFTLDEILAMPIVKLELGSDVTEGRITGVRHIWIRRGLINSPDDGPAYGWMQTSFNATPKGYKREEPATELLYE